MPLKRSVEATTNGNGRGNMKSSRNRRPLVLGGTVAILAVVAAVVAIFASGASSENPTSASEATLVTENFSFVHPANASEAKALPPEVQQVLASVGHGKAVDALGVATTPDGIETVIADMEGTVCAVKTGNNGGGGTCGTREEAVYGNLLSIAFCQGDLSQGTARIFGVMPDGIQAVSLEAADGTRQVKVADNTYEAEVPAEDTTISATSQAGGQIRVPVPLAELAKANGSCG